jgi:hypothetical protein
MDKEQKIFDASLGDVPKRILIKKGKKVKAIIPTSAYYKIVEMCKKKDKE